FDRRDPRHPSREEARRSRHISHGRSDRFLWHVGGAQKIARSLPPQFPSPGRVDSGLGRHRVNAPNSADPKAQLRRVMGFWDVLLFNIAAVLGPRWIAAAAHNGASSISLWVLAALLFFLPTTFIVVELSTRYPEEGGLYLLSTRA